MLNDTFQIRRVILCCGYVDMRRGIEGLAQIVGSRFKLNPYDKGTLFLFCGKRTDRIKMLLWMGKGFILMYRRFEDGHLSWPRTPEQAAELTEEQFHLLMRGFDPITVRVKDVHPKKIC